jgi:hypothetical protein
VLSTFVGYKQFESNPTAIGGNPAHNIVYSYSLAKRYLPLAQKMIDSFQFTGTGIAQ